MEQKRRYKEDFCANYDEYRTLHSELLANGQHFANLHELMKQQNNLGNTAMAQVLYCSRWDRILLKGTNERTPILI